MPITVTTVTDLPSGAHRLSPKILFGMLSLIAMLVSEAYARCSLPPAQTPNHNLVANLIPFKSLNLFTSIYLFLNLVFGAFSVFFAIMSKVDNNLPNTGKFASHTSGYFLTVELLCVLLLNQKARAFTIRRVKSWLESVEVSAVLQNLNHDRTANCTASNTGQPAEHLPASQVTNVQPDLVLGRKEELLNPARLILVKQAQAVL